MPWICPSQGCPPTELGFSWQDVHRCRLYFSLERVVKKGAGGGAEFLEVVGMVARVCHTCLPARMFACTGKASGEVE